MQHYPPMPDIKLAAGAEFDFATGAGQARTNSLLSQLMGLQKGAASYQRMRGTAIPTSSAVPTYIDLGAVPDGMVLELRSLLLQFVSTGVFGVAVQQPVAVFITGAPISNLSAVDAADVGTATPVNFLYPSDSMMAQAPEHIYVGVLCSATQLASAGPQFVATARGTMYPQQYQSDVQAEQH